MPAEEQSATPDRYLIVPRVVIFVRRATSYLLVRAAPNKRTWPGLYNGVGGHLERGEGALGAARRELLEETNLEADLWLCGTVVVDAGAIGVGLYVFTGEVTGGELRPSAEGEAEWVSIAQLPGLPTVSDVAPLVGRIHMMQRGDAPFSARSSYDQAGTLVIEFQS
jgi:8-oxo-dGTP diphosphatase